MKYFVLVTLFVIFSTLSLNKISKNEAYQQPQFKQALQEAIYATISSKNISIAPVVYELTISAIQKYPKISPEQLKNVFQKSMVNDDISKVRFFIFLHTNQLT